LPGTKEKAKRQQKAKDHASKRCEKRKEQQEPTQEAAEATKEKENANVKLVKGAMVRQGAIVNGNETRVKKGTGSAWKTTVGDGKKGTAKLAEKKSSKKQKRVDIPQGRRKVPTPGDESGCKHRGLMELVVCNKVWMAAYVKVGAWLHKMPCIDCAASCQDTSALSVLKQPKEGYICNCGPIAHKMEEEQEGKQAYKCNMMLCMTCYSDRVSKMETGPRSRRRRNTREREYS
jgi:hypothetical protein